MSYRRVIGACTAAATALLLTAVAAPPASAASPAPTGTTPRASSAQPEAAGAVRDPKRGKDKLDKAARNAPDTVSSWYVDEATGALVVEATNTADGTAFVASSDAAVDGAQVKQVGESPRQFFSLVGGQAIYNAGGRCSIGFSARKGTTAYVLTAGHCTQLGGSWAGFNHVGIGPTSTSNFPTDDFGSIRVTSSSWTPTSRVAGTSSVLGSTEAAVGASVCRSGSTTGFHCGTIQQKNATVNYGGGDIVFGLTRTNVCAEPGDSGGSFVSGRQAQGMTSGGSGNCTTGGTTFFQPVNEALSRLGLTLVTG